MKEIKAIIQVRRASQVIDAISEVPGVNGVTAVDARGFGRTRGSDGLERAASGAVHYIAKVMLIVVVADSVVEQVVRTIASNAHTGNLGDGLVFVTEVADALRIRTGERGVAAIS